MAKAKSKKITLEEALVPVEEQPYKVPKNWCWIHLLDSFDNVTDSKKKLATKEYLEDGEYPIIDQGQDFIGGYTDDADMIYDGELPIVIFGDHTRCIKYINFQFAQGADGVKVLKPKQFWNDKAFYYAMQSIEIPNMGYRRHYPLFKDFCIPLPPLAEQKRIVEQIESLFAKLDKAKEKALSVVESFELREKAIYKKAFEGDLTNSWRAENGINISEWEEIPFEKLGKLERGRSKHRPRNDKRLFGGKYPFIQTGDVAGAGMYVTSHKQTLSEFGFEQSRMFPKGTLCITIAANIGDAAILSYDCCFPDSVVGFTPGEKCLNKYMYFYLQEIKAELEYIAPATAQKNLNLKLLGKVEIKVPSLKEQEKIVEILEKQINDQENIVEKAENVIETIDVMKKSILAKAFRGELGTNIETEESAIELLKSIF